MQGETHRIASLEALRGIAALIVVVWHTMLAFAPQTTGIFSQLPPFEAYTGSPFFFLMNGNGAVNVFFVLSGFEECGEALSALGPPRPYLRDRFLSPVPL